MNGTDRGVLISDGRSGVRLIRTGPVNEPGYPTLIDVEAGPFRGSVKDYTVGYSTFRSQLAHLYDCLSGEAKLGSYDGFELDVVGNGSGAIAVRVKIIGQHVPLIQLEFHFSIDQTYQPPIIEQLDSEFPPPYRAAV